MANLGFTNKFYTITKTPPINISGTPSRGTIGENYYFVPIVRNINGVPRFTLYGVLPSGLNFNSTNGSIYGVPTNINDENSVYSIKVVDDLTTDTLNFTIEIARKSKIIALHGKQHDTAYLTSSTKTRLKGMCSFVIGANGANTISPVFSNFFLNNSDSGYSEGSAYTIVKASIVYNNIVKPIFFNKSRSRIVVSGISSLISDSINASDFSVSKFTEGSTVIVRVCADVVSSTTISSHKRGTFGSSNFAVAYAPSNHEDDIDLPTMKIPVNSDVDIPFPYPVMLVGNPEIDFPSVILFGDEIADGYSDITGFDNTREGWAKRAAFDKKIPILSLAFLNNRIRYTSTIKDKISDIMRVAGSRRSIISLGSQDIKDGRTKDEIISDYKKLVASLRAMNVNYIAQSTILSQVITTNQGTTDIEQTVIPEFAPLGVRDSVNSEIFNMFNEKIINDFVDIASPIQSNGKWNIPTYISTLSAPSLVGDNIVRLKDRPIPNEFLAFEPNVSNKNENNRIHVNSFTQSDNEFVTTLTGNLSKTHDIDALVRSSYSMDGIHPQSIAHQKSARKALSLMERIKYSVIPWSSPTLSFDVDFVNGLAQKDNIRTDIKNILSCAREGVAMAYDGQSWIDTPNNTLRYADGGNLLIEKESSNNFGNNTMKGGVAPNTRPTLWNFNNVPSTVSLTYSYSTQNGIRYMDIRFSGNVVNPVDITMVAVNRPNSTVDDSWALSGYFGNVGLRSLGLNSLLFGIIVISANSTNVEFVNGDITPLPNRIVSRMSTVVKPTKTSVARIAPRIVFKVSGELDFTVRIGAPQVEKSTFTTSPILTSDSTPTIRNRDDVTLTLPTGNHNVTIVFSDDTNFIYNNVSGQLKLDNLPKTEIKRIFGVRV